ncbi:MAG: DUF4390 domain-containing protein [Burkholderiales bacterium]|nr:DUF4390 domain-containing protein [Burkholderiales bacterium]
MRWPVVWLLALLLVLAGPIAPAQAADQGITVKEARLELADDGWQLSADFDIQFTPTLQEAVIRGVPLYFVIEFEAKSPRWYWFDKKTVQAERERRIAYLPLTEQYRMSVGNFSESIKTFDEVKRRLARVRGWAVTGRDSFKPGEKYDVQVRMRLDTAQLPKPFQITAFASKDWTLASDWFRWTLAPDQKSFVQPEVKVSLAPALTPLNAAAGEVKP